MLTLQQSKVFNFRKVAQTCDVMQIGFTRQIIVVLTTQGNVFTWGGVSNALGRKVSVKNSKQGKSPQQVPNIGIIVQIACGDQHVMALDNYGHVMIWGNNKYGQLGRERSEPTFYPEKVDLDVEITQIYASGNISVAIDRNGKIYGWGQNKNDILEMPPQKDAERKVCVENPIKIKEAWDTGPKHQIEVGIAPQMDSFVLFEKKGKKHGLGAISQDKYYQASQKIIELKKRNAQLQERIKDLERQLNDDYDSENDVNPNSINKMRDYSGVIENIDGMRRDLNKSIIGLQQQRESLQQRLAIINGDIDLTLKRMSKDCNHILIILKFLQLEESQHKQQQIKLQIKKLTELLNQNSGRPEQLKYQRKLDELEQLLFANTDVKSKVHSNLNQREKSKYQLHQQISATSKQLGDLDRNDKLLSQFKKDSRALLIFRYLSSNLTDLQKIFDAFQNLHIMLKQTEVSHICRLAKQPLGYKEAIFESIKQMDGILSQAGDLKIGPDDPRFDIFSVLYNLFDDNVYLRKQVGQSMPYINIFMEALLEQTNQKLQSFYQQGASVDRFRPQKDEKLALSIKLHKNNARNKQEANGLTGGRGHANDMPTLFDYQNDDDVSELERRFGGTSVNREKQRYKVRFKGFD